MPTILVVDDSSVDRRLVGGLLEKRLVCTVKYAANGAEALALMKDPTPDLVVTDLTMPVMNGLELVKALRVDHADLPVVLMTAYGSETLAIEALECGATSYVPKSQLTRRLTKSVDEVLAMVRTARSSKQLLGCLGRAEFSFVLENEAALVDPLVDLVQNVLSGVNLCDFTERLQVGLALKEAVLNALFHGNLEIETNPPEESPERLLKETDVSWMEERRSQPPYRDRKIHVEVTISPQEARFVVRDDGTGFDPAAVPEPGDPGALEAERGRGLSLMRTFMDEIDYNEIGNEVAMVKRRSEHPSKTIEV